MEEVHHRCKRCSNRCHATYVVDDEGVAVDSWRNRPAFGETRREKCRNLATLHGKPLPIMLLDVM